MVTVREVLECATIGGAANAGLLHKCGALTPGKEADLVMIQTDDINLYPSNHAIGTVVAAADVRNIDTVIIGVPGPWPDSRPSSFAARAR
jgi:cytosine/adenosine deaminase-related metal-dependent hydrolase